MPLGLQGLDRLVAQRSGEGLWFGVGMHDQNVHGESLKGRDQK
jgi:hypothetical protein